MKKYITIFLVIFILCFTACNNQTVETSTASSKTEQTESTSISQSTEISQTTQISQTNITIEPTTETNEKPIEANGYVVPDELKDKIVYPQRAWFMDFPSRIVFSQSSKDKLVGSTYRGQGGNKIVYYSKADGETYYNCFDPLCDHSACALSGIIDTSKMTVYNNRFYKFESGLGTIYSFSFDGSDMKKEYQMFDEPKNGISPFRGFAAYDRYWFISFLHEDGTDHCLRFDMETSEMVDLTEKTGNYLFPSFFYNGEMYSGIYKKSDLSLEKIDDVNTDKQIRKGFYTSHTIGEVFFGCVIESVTDDNGQSVPVYLGIGTYNIETGEETFVSSETIGKNVVSILYVDENYVYFISDDKGEYLGKNRNGMDVYNSGTLYRVNQDGTNCICVFSDKNKRLYSLYPLTIYEDKIFIQSAEVDFVGEYVQTWNEGMYIGTIQADGTIDKLEYIEVIE